MHIDDFAYELPEEAIAQTPLAVRDDSRLLIAGSPSDPAASPVGIEHGHMRDFPRLVGPGDVIVVNTTRVLPARLKLFRPTGGGTEVFLLEPAPTDDDPAAWEALIRPSKKVHPGTVLRTDDGRPLIRVTDDLGQGRRRVHALTGSASGADDAPSIEKIAHHHGSVPTPPYVRTALDDPERYQTVYAEREVSVAAPTAGLHFTEALLDECRAAGAEVHPLELAVGIGTFRPISVDDVTEHEMHTERYAVSPATWDACDRADRVIAIGTTSVRALESAATSGRLDGGTDLFISPGYEWKIVDALLTNFHQPRSSLLVMLAAFAGERWRPLYAEALSAGYRFLSFGDAMFVDRAERAST